MEGQRQLSRVISLLLPCVGSGSQIQVIMSQGSCLQPLRLLTGPEVGFSKDETGYFLQIGVGEGGLQKQRNCLDPPATQVGVLGGRKARVHGGAARESVTPGAVEGPSNVCRGKQPESVLESEAEQQR